MSVAADQQAALIREAFLEMGSAGWKAHKIGMSEEQMITLLAKSMEPLVQALTRRCVS